MVKQVNELLGAKLADFVSGLEEDAETGRVMGYVVSSDFDRMEQASRQKRVREILKAALPSEQYRLVGPIVTMSPAEADVDSPVED